MYPGVLYRTSRNAAHAGHGRARSAHHSTGHRIKR
nr:MAG TPA: hypothetical protein [Caudoviricetes sp.]